MIDKMNDLSGKIEQAQIAFCAEHGTQHAPSPPDSKLGFALSTEGKQPVNGLRHPARGQTCGWYIWCGEDFSDASDFFSPLHVKHLYEHHPELGKLLGLPPGYRFLLAGDYFDVWYDAALLRV